MCFFSQNLNKLENILKLRPSVAFNSLLTRLFINNQGSISYEQKQKEKKWQLSLLTVALPQCLTSSLLI